MSQPAVHSTRDKFMSLFVRLCWRVIEVCPRLRHGYRSGDLSQHYEQHAKNDSIWTVDEKIAVSRWKDISTQENLSSRQNVCYIICPPIIEEKERRRADGWEVVACRDEEFQKVEQAEAGEKRGKSPNLMRLDGGRVEGGQYTE